MYVAKPEDCMVFDVKIHFCFQNYTHPLSSGHRPFFQAESQAVDAASGSIDSSTFCMLLRIID
jgi:hypothetical protein